ncbi:polyprenyl synthetase family protein [Nocardioides pacificus]
MTTPADVQGVLDRVLADGAARGATLGEDHVALWTALADATRGGKRFRPALVAAVHDCLVPDADEEARAAVAAVGAAVELLHTAFVIHDDVIDGDDTRRGRPSVPGRFIGDIRERGAEPRAARGYAVAGALLTGDLALAAAIRTVATCPAPPEVIRALLDLFDHALHVSAVGELADVRMSLDLGRADPSLGPSLGEVLTMEEHKTAVYSFELPMQAGAVLAGADPATVTGLGQVGRQLGVAFQLLDDLLGVFGDPARTGKSALGDLREGKRTPLIVHARTTTTWPEIAAHLGDPALSEQQADVVRRALEAGGSRAFIEQLAQGYLEAAVAQAAELGAVDLTNWVGAMSDELLKGAA